MKLLTAALFFILLIPLQRSCAVSPTGCDAAEPVAGKALDLINKGWWDGYLFQLLRVTDVHLDKGSTAVYYLVLDVKETDCSVLSRKHWDDCEPAVSIRPSDIVIGQCKVIAITRLDGSQNLRVNDFNCTTSSAANYFLQSLWHWSILKTAQYSQISLRILSSTENKLTKPWRSTKRENDLWILQSRFVFDVEDSDLETPKDIVINCEVFNLKEHTNISGVKHRLGLPLHSGEHEHAPAGRPSFKPNGSRDHHNPHESHNFRCPPPLEDKNYSDRVPLPLPPPGSRAITLLLTPVGPMGPLIIIVLVSAILTDTIPMDIVPMNTIPMAMISMTMDPVTHHPIAKVPKTTITEAMAHHLGTQKKDVQKGEVLPLPEASFPSFSLPNHNNLLQPEIQAFPQSASESCPGEFKN
eukprot:bmy_11080T0